VRLEFEAFFFVILILLMMQSFLNHKILNKEKAKILTHNSQASFNISILNEI
jgi:hypothetical protein